MIVRISLKGIIVGTNGSKPSIFTRGPKDPPAKPHAGEDVILTVKLENGSLCTINIESWDGGYSGVIDIQGRQLSYEVQSVEFDGWTFGRKAIPLWQ